MPSTLGLIYMRYRGAYAAMKHAIEALSDTMRLEMEGTGVEIVLIEPGPITTKFRENGIPGLKNTSIADHLAGRI